MPTHMVLYVQDHLIAAITPPTGFSLTEMPNDRGGTDLRVMRGLDTVLKLRVRVNSFAITVQSSSPLSAPRPAPSRCGAVGLDAAGAVARPGRAGFCSVCGGWAAVAYCATHVASRGLVEPLAGAAGGHARSGASRQ
jgi:hypothetical protein